MIELRERECLGWEDLNVFKLKKKDVVEKEVVKL